MSSRALAIRERTPTSAPSASGLKATCRHTSIEPGQTAGLSDQGVEQATIVQRRGLADPFGQTPAIPARRQRVLFVALGGPGVVAIDELQLPGVGQDIGWAACAVGFRRKHGIATPAR
jgi:hypothetical protein